MLTQNHQSLKQQKGVVIVVALFIVAIVATISYVMMARLERDTARTSLLTRNIKAELYAQGSIVWAIDQLRFNWENQKPNQLIDVMPFKSPIINVEAYQIQSTLNDMQGRFNINNLTNPDYQPIFKRLVQNAAPDMPEQKIQELMTAILDWLQPSPQQNEFTKYYAQLLPPYAAGHRAMLSVSELQLVKGMTPALYTALAPSLSALPEVTPINVQTAPVQVLAALSATLTGDAVHSIDLIRAQTPFVATQAFTDLDIIKNHPLFKDTTIGITSGYFLVETDVAIEKQHVVLYTLLARTKGEGKAAVNILWQSKGVW